MTSVRYAERTNFAKIAWSLLIGRLIWIDLRQKGLKVTEGVQIQAFIELLLRERMIII